jgi:hypothetical protein
LHNEITNVTLMGELISRHLNELFLPERLGGLESVHGADQLSCASKARLSQFLSPITRPRLVEAGNRHSRTETSITAPFFFSSSPQQLLKHLSFVSRMHAASVRSLTRG